MSPEELERLAVLGRPLEDLNITTYVLNLLYNLEYCRTLGSLIQRSPNDLLMIPRFGEDSLHRLVKALGEWGLELARVDYTKRR